MSFNDGNIKKKSKILYLHMFNDDCVDDFYTEIYNNYNESRNQINGINEYKKIERCLHDSYIKKITVYNDIIFDLQLFIDDEEKTINKKMTFVNSKIVSYNKILKSGKIKKINKKFRPYEYLYDEFYKFNNNNYITIIVTTKSKINTGYYFPMITIKFETIKISG